ncbi:MAG: hypothetical protein ABI288_07815 [Ginsengibacter sp.]
MKKFFIITLLSITSLSIAFAQDVQTANQKKFMQITTVESVTAGGLGRSKLIVTNPDGSQKDSDMKNLFSVAGINYNNIKANEEKIVMILKEYSDSGWTLVQVTPLTLSPNESGSGIFMTRYLLSNNE